MLCNFAALPSLAYISANLAYFSAISVAICAKLAQSILIFFSMHVMSHNWSAMKQRHSQSVAEISRHSVLSGTAFDNVGHRSGLATTTQISVCKSPFPSAGTAVSLFRAKTVQQRPLLPREVETRAVKTGFSVQPVTGLVKPVSNRFTVL